MNRRAFLSTLGIATLPGCGALNESQAAETTTTEQPPEPEIEAVALISDWKEFGDVLDNEIESIAPSESPMIGFRFKPVCNDEREVRWRSVVTIQDSTGEAVASESTENEEFTNNCGGSTQLVEWEQAVTVWYDNEYGTEWPEGTYEAEVRIDDYYGQATVSETTEFEVVG